MSGRCMNREAYGVVREFDELELVRWQRFEDGIRAHNFLEEMDVEVIAFSGHTKSHVKLQWRNEGKIAWIIKYTPTVTKRRKSCEPNDLVLFEALNLRFGYLPRHSRREGLGRRRRHDARADLHDFTLLNA